jgi:hypothetical protein
VKLQRRPEGGIYRRPLSWSSCSGVHPMYAAQGSGSAAEITWRAAAAPRPAQVSDLDPGSAAARLDRDRLAWRTRAAVPQTIGEKARPPARRPHPRTGDYGPAHPPRTHGPPAPAPAAPKASRPPEPPATAFPAARTQGNHELPGRHNGMDARLGRARQAWTHHRTVHRNLVKRHTHRSLAPIPVRYVSVRS